MNNHIYKLWKVVKIFEIFSNLNRNIYVREYYNMLKVKTRHSAYWLKTNACKDAWKLKILSKQCKSFVCFSSAVEERSSLHSGTQFTINHLSHLFFSLSYNLVVVVVRLFHFPTRSSILLVVFLLAFSNICVENDNACMLFVTAFKVQCTAFRCSLRCATIWIQQMKQLWQARSCKTKKWNSIWIEIEAFRSACRFDFTVCFIQYTYVYGMVWYGMVWRVCTVHAQQAKNGKFTVALSSSPLPSILYSYIYWCAVVPICNETAPFSFHNG